MNMIGNSINREKLMLLIINDAGDVFIQFRTMVFFYDTLPVFNSENHLNGYLGIGICHDFKYLARQL